MLPPCIWVSLESKLLLYSSRNSYWFELWCHVGKKHRVENRGNFLCTFRLFKLISLVGWGFESILFGEGKCYLSSKCFSEFTKARGPVRRRQWHPIPVQYSCLENPMGGGAWKAAGHGVAKGRTRLSDFTFTFHFHFSLSCIGEGNGNPLQCSCLENPRDGGAWWAAVYGVAQKCTRLKWLSSSSRGLVNVVLKPRDVGPGDLERNLKFIHLTLWSSVYLPKAIALVSSAIQPGQVGFSK